MTTVGIVGAGIAGLHLGLALRAADVPVTLYADRPFDELAAGPLLNTVAHHHPLLERERALGVHHWPAAEFGYRAHHHWIGGLRFTGRFTHPSCAVDHRLYLPRLAEDLAARGGHVEVREAGPRDLGALARRHELLVVASGRGALSGLFPRRPEHSPHDAPRRLVCAGLYTGIAPAEPAAVTIGVAPGQGELLEIPLVSRHGRVTALLFENVPGGDLAVLNELSPAEDPALFRKTVVEKLHEHHPATAERLLGDFALTDPRDLLQGAVTPAVREDFLSLGDDRFALALGDAHVVVDPVMGQGANIAAYSAAVVAAEIAAETVYDEVFCRRVARAREEVLLGASAWTNLVLDPPPWLGELWRGLADDPRRADEFTDNFDHPDRQWRALATRRRVRAFLDGS
ncbi:styrene monooxygenase/indole monooxygenase family protein [Amycolatopsis sp. ATCC 39116]|uniref:styrene monooxygenase/indole monooxygenase family protein n=1 Tax=Amycolatopsis sp. (strain ATCC 39116 / 75iv2) TaxID=385957 RepID=UPI00026290A5|nr:styrene monooxygenase/indole monooxygenase family protein [Amycolatopsis sp. ATCC 39116]